jgi:hypothetical protein
MLKLSNEIPEREKKLKRPKRSPKHSSHSRQTKGLSNTTKIAIGTVLAGLTIYGITRETGTNNQKTPAVSESAQENISFPALADQLEQYANQMDPLNKEKLRKVIALMRNNLPGIKLEKSNFSDHPAIIAESEFNVKQSELGMEKITLNENWNSDNFLDIALIVHELFHLAEIREHRKTLTPENWTKIYGLSHNSLEIRSELSAWELGLVLLDKMTNGALDKFYHEIIKLDVENFDLAQKTVRKYSEKIAKIGNISENQKNTVERWLQIYLNYRAFDTNNLDCKWTYNFVTQITKEYQPEGIQLYELELPESATGKFPEQCLYPLQGGPYRSYWPYVRRRDGLIGPASEPVHFQTQ